MARLCGFRTGDVPFLEADQISGVSEMMIGSGIDKR